MDDGVEHSAGSDGDGESDEREFVSRRRANSSPLA